MNLHYRIYTHDTAVGDNLCICSHQVVFNGIDVGEYFDYAVTSLCVALGVSYVAASSYGHTAVVDCYPSLLLPRDGPCWACNNSPSDRDILSQLAPTCITNTSSLSFFPKVNPPNGALTYTKFWCTIFNQGQHR